MSRVFQFLVAICFTASLHAQVFVKNPARDYLDIASSDPEMKSALEKTQKIFILDLKLHRNHPLVRFYAIDGYSGKSGNIWTAYLPVKAGYLRLPGDQICFRPDYFFSGQVGDVRDFGLLVLSPTNGGGDLCLYRLRGRRIEKRKLHPLCLNVENGKVFWKTYFQGPSPAQPLRAPLEHPVRQLTLEQLRSEASRAETGGKSTTPPTVSKPSR